MDLMERKQNDLWDAQKTEKIVQKASKCVFYGVLSIFFWYPTKVNPFRNIKGECENMSQF